MVNTAVFAAKHSENCPQCGTKLVIRSGRHGPFLGCSRYPECDFIRQLRYSGNSHIVKILEGKHCPLCQATLVLRQGRYGMFICCGDYPACTHTETIDKPDATEISCPQCAQGCLLQRKSRFGKIFHACDRYPECHFTINFLPVAGECESCHYPLLVEKKTARGNKRFCASRLCGKPVSID